MRLDIYRSADQGGNLFFLAVPEGQVIPAEATNTEWRTAAHAIELDEVVDQLPDYFIEKPIEQISEKGYAITSLKNISSGIG